MVTVPVANLPDMEAESIFDITRSMEAAFHQCLDPLLASTRPHDVESLSLSSRPLKRQRVRAKRGPMTGSARLRADVAGIHVLLLEAQKQGVDGRDKAGRAACCCGCRPGR
jgi:hypothetical protein